MQLLEVSVIEVIWSDKCDIFYDLLNGEADDGLSEEFNIAKKMNEKFLSINNLNDL